MHRPILLCFLAACGGPVATFESPPVAPAAPTAAATPLAEETRNDWPPIRPGSDPEPRSEPFDWPFEAKVGRRAGPAPQVRPGEVASRLVERDLLR